MSQANVDTIRRLNKAFNAGDRDGWLELVHPDVVYYEATGFLDTPDVIRGRGQLRQAIDAFVSELDGFRGSILELAASGARVFCLTEWTGVGRQSGVPLEFVEPIVWTLRDGLVVEGRVFTDRAAALEAVGLSE